MERALNAARAPLSLAPNASIAMAGDAALFSGNGGWHNAAPGKDCE